MLMARTSFHIALLNTILKIDENGVPSIADKDSKTSINISLGILERLGKVSKGSRKAGQTSGKQFEEICKEYLARTFGHLSHLRPGEWNISKGLGGGRLTIAQFDQYEHLAALDKASKENPNLAASIGTDYLIKPDVIITRKPEEDEKINENEFLVDENQARLTSLRKINNDKLILHASISCKWTIRSDRAQNARSEALNLVRNRKGRLPHIVVVTCEPLPSRIASIALGTGDIDCVYHFALPELQESVKNLELEDSREMLEVMVGGKRLRDISDLPFDLVV